MEPVDGFSTDITILPEEAVIHFTLGGLLGDYTISGVDDKGNPADYDIQFGTPLMARAVQPTQTLSLLEDSVLLSSLSRVVKFINVECGNAEEEEAKKKADSVKAGVARKTEYNEAADLMQSGDSLYSMQNAKKAAEKYKEANTKFTYLYQDVSEKRAAAQAAIEEAKKRVAESEKFAEEADVKAPITEQVEGIEDEDAVLLEADEYENPEEAEADLPESIEELEEGEAE